MTLFKVLRHDGRCAHGGDPDFAWPLPEGGPGAWIEHAGPLIPCVSGLHLTDKPERWWTPRARVFEAEADGVEECVGWDGKWIARRARLVREVTPEERREILRQAILVDLARGDS